MCRPVRRRVGPLSGRTGPEEVETISPYFRGNKTRRVIKWFII